MPSIADVIDLIAAELPDVTVRFGEEFKEENEAPPRVVFIPRGDRFTPAGQRSSNPRSPHRSIQTRGVGLEARIWAAASEGAAASYPEMRALELLVDRVCIAAYEVAQGSIVFEDGEYAPTGNAQYGRLYILRFRIALPVIPPVDDAAATVTTFAEVLAAADPAAIETTVEFAGTEEVGIPTP